MWGVGPIERFMELACSSSSLAVENVVDGIVCSPLEWGYGEGLRLGPYATCSTEVGIGVLVRSGDTP